jgi:hypothetical protein
LIFVLQIQMGYKIFNILLCVLILSTGLSYADDSKQTTPLENTEIYKPNPFIQLSGGIVYSSIDLSRYVSSIAYRGAHARLVTHIKGPFYISTEYSVFPTHDSPSAWEKVNTRKFDINGQLSFTTKKNSTQIFVFIGANNHKWAATRTGNIDLGQSARGITKGSTITVKRWSVNFGCGFNQILYENIGVFGDCRFNFGNAKDFEKVRILDVMTTLGFSFTLPHPSKFKKNGSKSNIIDRKKYIWTHTNKTKNKFKIKKS